jgi:ribosomal protein S18 acetylase RimI-like enzyme
VRLVPVCESHRAALARLVHDTREFSADEATVAMELVDAAIAGSADYRVIVCERAGALLGYVCFGPTPMTDGTYDLYWIAVSEGARGQGVGRDLVMHMMRELSLRQARLVRVETSGQAAYASTRAFYEKTKFEVVARVRDFYRPGDDLVVYGKYL